MSNNSHDQNPWHIGTSGAILVTRPPGAPENPSAVTQFVLFVQGEVIEVLTISRLSRWSIDYYNDTADKARAAAMDRQSANGGLGEYYSDGDTRAPTWILVGDTARVAGLVGLDGGAADGGFADTAAAAAWLNDGVAPNGVTGRAFSKGSVHGFDLTFAAPKSVSLMRALTDDVAEKVMATAHLKAVNAAMTYLHTHAGYTRVHNPATGTKDLQRLPGLVAIAYQHETSRCGDPHLHTHVIVPNRQARADGKLVSIDSKSRYHEAKAAGIIYQATLRHELHTELGLEFNPVDERTGMAEIAGIDKDCMKAWSQRSTRLREWAKQNLVVVGGTLSAAQTAAAQKATRPTKPESLAWGALTAGWRADERGLVLDRAAHFAARDARRAAPRTLDTARVAELMAHIDKAAFTRADMVELLGAQLPVDLRGNPRTLIENAVDTVGVRVSAPRQAHEREGHEKYTLDLIMAEEDRVLGMVDASDNGSRLDVRPDDVAALSADQGRAIRAIALSPFLVQPLAAPAGAGKTHSLHALRAGAHRARKQVLVLAPTGRAVDEAIRDGAGDRGLTVAKALHLFNRGELRLDRRTVVVVDEASMVATPDLWTLLAAATEANVKTVLVGDPYQLAPVKARGGMFEQLCADLPWSQRLSAVWRMRDPAERDASLALRSGHGNRLRRAVGWYRIHGRLHTGDPIAMAHDALTAYTAGRAAGKDSLLICDTWEMADALNRRLHDTLSAPDATTAHAARDQLIAKGDLIISRHNDPGIEVAPGTGHRADDPIDQVRNGNRWRVAAVNPDTNRIAAIRTTDRARVIFEGDYLREHVTLGYAVTVHSAQGVTVGGADTPGTCHAILSEGASRAIAYVAMTRATDDNHAYIYTRESGEGDHEHRPLGDGEVHQLRRGNTYSAAHYLKTILANNDRPVTMHAEADRTQRHQLPGVVAHLLERNDARRTARAQTWRQHAAAERARHAAHERLTAAADQAAEQVAERSLRLDVDGLEL
jgi:conjugative relaxase-like TrwC/TraI family protein